MQSAEADAMLAGTSGEVSVLATLMRAQLALMAGDSRAVAELLGSLPDADLRHRPAIIATLASLQASPQQPETRPSPTPLEP